LSEAGLLYGPFATRLPNSALFDFSSSGLKYDFGYPTAGYEMPYNVAQFTLIYNAAMVGNTPPASLIDLIAWIKAHPGKFAYPVPSESSAFESAALLRHFLGALCPPYSSFFGAFDEAKYMACTNGTAHPTFWEQLNDLHGSLWVNPATNRTTPPAAGAMDDLFASGQIAFTFSYDPFRAASAVADGTWNATTTRSYVFTAGNLIGTIANTNFVAIPKNAPNLAAALVTANAIASPAQMFARAHANVWGTFPAYTPGRIDEGWEAAFEEIDAVRSVNTPQFDTLAAHALGELDAAYGARLEADWARFVAHA
jgi:putative spermidine/putrescine transport system substrate-binding protein